jgi:hypothetical protein
MFSADVTHPLSLPQILGYIATIFGIIGFQQKDDTKLRIFVCCMSVFIVWHFILMGSFSAAICAFLAATRWGLSIFARVRKYAHFLVPLYVLLFIAAGYLSYERWFDVLPILASISGTFALFYCTKLRLRLVLLLGGSLWVVHNFLALSYGPLVMESFIFISNAIMIARFINDNKKLPRDPRDSFLSRFG